MAETDQNPVFLIAESLITKHLNSVRIGCVKYLNARPLIRGWPGPVHFDHPSALCERLANGDLELALVSSLELLRNPIYRIVDGVSISSNGPVYSVVVAHRGDISQVEEIGLDPASETAIILLRCLFAELGLKARFASGKQFENEAQRRGPSNPCGRLLIGDQAIHFRQKHANEFGFWDLGEEWEKLVGLPFVYALWLVRPEVAAPKEIANRLRVLRDENLTHLEPLIAAEKEFDPQFCSRYYREHLRFGFGDKEKKGLKTFAKICAKHRLLLRCQIALDLV